MSWEITVTTIIAAAFVIGIMISFAVRMVKDGEKAQVREMNSFSSEKLDCRTMAARDVVGCVVRDMEREVPVSAFAFVDYVTPEMADDVDVPTLDYGIAVGYGTPGISGASVPVSQKSYVIRSERLHGGESGGESVHDAMVARRRKMIYSMRKVLDAAVAAYAASDASAMIDGRKREVEVGATVVDDSAMRYIMS